VSSDSPSISLFVGLSLNVRRNWTIRLNSGSDRCCSMRFSLIEEVSALSDEESSFLRSIEFTLSGLTTSVSFVSGLRLKPSALSFRFPLRRFLYPLLVLLRLRFFPDMPNFPRIVMSSLFWRLIGNWVIWSATTPACKILRLRFHVRSTFSTT